MKVPDTAQVAGAPQPAPTAAAIQGAPVAEPAMLMVRSAGIRMLTEPIAAAARLTGHTRVLIAACRPGDGASTVAGALALDLASRLGIDTLLVTADGAGAESPAAGNGRPVRTNQTGVPHLWLARCTRSGEPARGGAADGERAERDAVVEELRAIIGRYRAAIIDLGVVRLDARMLALARPEDPVLVVARYGCTQREELAATLAVINVANAKSAGVILNGYESPAADRLPWISHPEHEGR